MWIFDIENYHFLQVNNAAIAHYQYAEAEFLNMKLFDIVVDEYSISEKLSRAKVISFSDNIYKGRFRHRKKNNEIIVVDIYSSLITMNDKKYESVISIDITEKIIYEHKITKAIINTQEEERFEIGTELHDNVCQILASSQLSLEMLKDKIDPNALHWLNKSKEFVNLALEEIRNISHRLAPSFFGETTIEDTFIELLNNFNADNRYSLKMNIDFAKVNKKLSSDIQLNLYRILQEQMRNIVKYANASKIKISLQFEIDKLIFTIEDNGIGFNYLSVKKGIGLANISRRAELFSGTMEIDSSPNQGCKMIIHIPI
jgi:PAS domain S-box-containing protein